MKTRIFFIAFMFLLGSQAFTQPNNGHWKYKPNHAGKALKKHHKKMHKHEREYYCEFTKSQKEYYREIRKRELEHLKECHRCNHAFYHNDDDYKEAVYYSRKTRSPITIDAEFLFKNGSIRVQL